MAVFVTGAGIVPNLSGLPSGYTQLEYIESTGTQYIDTKVNPTNLTRFILDAQMTQAITNSTYACYFGCRKDGYYFELYKASPSNTNLTFLWGTIYSQYYSNIDYSKRRIVEINKNKSIVDGITLQYSNQTFSMSLPIYIGADNNNSTASSITQMKIFAASAYENDQQIRNFIPCKNSDGIIGLYDTINKVFYSNAGSGSFVAGPEL